MIILTPIEFLKNRSQKGEQFHTHTGRVWHVYVYIWLIWMANVGKYYRWMVWGTCMSPKLNKRLVYKPQYLPFTSRWTIPLILSPLIHPNFRPEKKTTKLNHERPHSSPAFCCCINLTIYWLPGTLHPAAQPIARCFTKSKPGALHQGFGPFHIVRAWVMGGIFGPKESMLDRVRSGGDGPKLHVLNRLEIDETHEIR